MNIGEVARQAGVSRSTVSYVLSGKRQIGERTRARVLAIIDEAGYRPSATARALAHGSTRTLALVVPRLHHRLNIEILQFVGAIAEAAAEHGFDTLISTSGAGQREDVFARMVGERRVDGVILMETLLPDARVELLMGRQFPFVTIGRAGHDDEHDWVDTDYGGLVSEAVSTLAEKGHRRIALVNRPREMMDLGYCLSLHARSAFEQTCERLGLHGVMVCCEEDDDAGKACLDEILIIDPNVTGIVSVNDRSLASLLESLHERQLSVPGDVSVIAVAADRVATRTAPPVTAADVPAARLATTAVDTLLTRIGSPESDPVRQLFRTPFTDRGSVARARRR